MTNLWHPWEGAAAAAYVVIKFSAIEPLKSLYKRLLGSESLIEKHFCCIFVLITNQKFKKFLVLFFSLLIQHSIYL